MTEPRPVADPIVTALRLALAEIAARRAAEKGGCLRYSPVGATKRPIPLSESTGPSKAPRTGPTRGPDPGKAGPGAKRRTGRY